MAIANLQILHREKLLERVRDDIGPYFQEGWRKLGDHPLVGEARTVGLLGALELVRSKEPIERFDEKEGVGTICRDTFVNNGLVMRAVGDTMVAAPPLVISHAEVDELIETAWTCLDLTQRAVDG